jgi:hypothetical protein
MEKEIWKDVDSWWGLYQVSNKSNVRSLDRRMIHPKTGSEYIIKGRILKKALTRGYETVCFKSHKKQVNLKVHRLVAMAFIENPEGKPQVNHIDGVKTNNSIDNLEWCTNTENRVHAFRTGLQSGKMGELNSMCKLTDYEVKCIKALLNKGKLKHKDIASLFGISRSHVSGISAGNKRKHVKTTPT